jgi:shikimate kinase
MKEEKTMNKHLLLIGFSCTGKTSLGKRAFDCASIVDSDKALLDWITKKTGNRFEHIYELFINLGREKAMASIAEAEQALITSWAGDTIPKIISLGPGFPLHGSWSELRKVSRVVLLRRPAEGIYEGFLSRRKNIFNECPAAKDHDNWDIGVIVDEHRKEFPREIAIKNIERLLAEREPFYRDNDLALDTKDQDCAVKKLRALLES